MKISVVFAAYLLSFAACACVPDFADKILSDPLTLEHPAVIATFEQVQRNLSALYINTTRDGLSFAVVRIGRFSSKSRSLTTTRFTRQAQNQHTLSTTER
jgi:hypothetical protein